MVLKHIIKASSKFIPRGSKINASKAINIAHGLTRTTLRKPGDRKRGSMYKMPGETIREEGGGISRTSNGRTTYSPGKLSDSEISKLRIQASNLMNKKRNKLNQVDKKIASLEKKITTDKNILARMKKSENKRSVGTWHPANKLSDAEISKLRIQANTMINKKINAKDKLKKSISRSDILRIIKNKLPVKQRPIRTKTKPKYPGLEAKKKSANLTSYQKKKEKFGDTMSMGLYATPRSKVPDKLDLSKIRGSEFEQRQRLLEKRTDKARGATKDGRFRNPLSRKGEESYDPDMAKKWTGVGLGVAGGGTLAWNQKKNKFPDPIKFG